MQSRKQVIEGHRMCSNMQGIGLYTYFLCLDMLGRNVYKFHSGEVCSRVKVPNFVQCLYCLWGEKM